LSDSSDVASRLQYVALSALGFGLLLVCADSAHKAHLGVNKPYGQSTTAAG